MKPIEGAWLAIKRNLITQAAYLVTFNNQQAIQRQLGTHHSYFPHPVRPADPCVLNQPRVPPTKRKANTNYINYWFFQKVGYITISFPIKPPAAPIPCWPSKFSPPIGNFEFADPKGISNKQHGNKSRTQTALNYVLDIIDTLLLQPVNCRLSTKNQSLVQKVQIHYILNTLCVTSTL